MLTEIFGEEVSLVRVWVGNESMDVYHAVPGAVERAQASGYDGQLVSHLRERNAADWEKFVDWLGRIDDEWHEIAPGAHSSTPSSE